MRLVDANVLLYAVNQDARHHDSSRRWLDTALSGGSSVAFAWVPLLAFVRVSTHPDLFPTPLTTDQAFACVDAWLAAPPAVIIEPGPGHSRTMRSFLATTGVGANLVNDAHMAALAIDHRCTVVSYDNDFARFDGLRWERPDHF